MFIAKFIMQGVEQQVLTTLVTALYNGKHSMYMSDDNSNIQDTIQFLNWEKTQAIKYNHSNWLSYRKENLRV